MNREEAFLLDLRERPDDDLTRLAYADWLEEQDDPRGRYLRVEVELSRLTEDVARYATLETELQDLRGQIEPEWLEQAGKRYDVVLSAYTGPYENKISVIKAMRELLHCELREAMLLVEGRAWPVTVLEGVSRQAAEQGREHLRYARGEKITEVELIVNTSGRRAVGAVGAPAPSALEAGPFDLYLCSYQPDSKIFAIKIIRELTGLGLKEAKDLSEAPPPPVRIASGLSREQADAAVARFEKRAVVVVVPAANAFEALFSPPAPAPGLDLYLCSYPPQYKINLIKAIREVTNLGLRDAKDLSERPLPVCLGEGLSPERVEWAVARFEGKARLEARPGKGSAPAARPAAGPAAPVTGRQALVLRSYPPTYKINVIKLIREWTGLGLREAKDLSEAKLPVTVCELTPERAELARRAFSAFAEVELRPVEA
jgi:uncharacterized protein (TIGR02996 family)